MTAENAIRALRELIQAMRAEAAAKKGNQK
jgi:hypothetical protein